MIGIQIGAVSFVDEGVAQVLDAVQARAGVNTLFLPVMAFNRGLSGRQIPGEPLPDHGVQAYDTDTFRGGYYARIHPEYYRDSAIDPRDVRAPELGDFDVLASVLPEAHARGMTVIAFLADNFRRDIPHAETALAEDVHGRAMGEACFNKPSYQAFLHGMVEDVIRSYEIDGLLWRTEQLGPMSNVLDLHHTGNERDAGCFCSYCAARASDGGIDVDRARAGYRALEAFRKEAKAGRRPTDGYYVTFWRILLTYPEILQWEQMQLDSLRAMMQAVYARAKSIEPDLPVGWALASRQIYNPIYRAQQDIAAIAPYSDFLKVALYSTVSGQRVSQFAESATRTAFADLPPDEFVQFVYRVMGYEGEAPYEELRATGLSPGFISRETQRALAAAEGTNTQIWPAIDIGLPARPFGKPKDGYVKTTPERVKHATLAVLQAGADGIILARKYAEMNLTDLAGVGAALGELGYESSSQR